MNQERRIILASASPRRFELMTRIGFEATVFKSDVEELRGVNETPQAYTERLAKDKAFAALDAAQGMWILSADTIVILDGEVLEKPTDEEDAKRMLRSMSGRTHKVLTSFCWLDSKSSNFAVKSVIADVEMIPLTEATINAYVATGESMDKAGAYGIQEVGATLVRGVIGSYFCVMGLPVCEVVEVLRELGGLTTFPFPPEGV